MEPRFAVFFCSALAAPTVLMRSLVAFLMLLGAGAADSCKGGMLEAVKQMAPDCIAECPKLCLKLNGIIMTALMGMDPTQQAWHGLHNPLHMSLIRESDRMCQVCASFETFVCMDRPECTSLLQAAASYNLFPVPQNEAELRETCGMPVPGMNELKLSAHNTIIRSSIGCHRTKTGIVFNWRDVN